MSLQIEALSPIMWTIIIAVALVLIAAVVFTWKSSAMSTRKMVTIAMLTAVYVVLNFAGTVRLGWIKYLRRVAARHRGRDALRSGRRPARRSSRRIHGSASHLWRDRDHDPVDPAAGSARPARRRVCQALRLQVLQFLSLHNEAWTVFPEGGVWPGVTSSRSPDRAGREG